MQVALLPESPLAALFSAWSSVVDCRFCRWTDPTSTTVQPHATNTMHNCISPSLCLTTPVLARRVKIPTLSHAVRACATRDTRRPRPPHARTRARSISDDEVIKQMSLAYELCSTWPGFQSPICFQGPETVPSRSTLWLQHTSSAKKAKHTASSPIATHTSTV